MWTPNTESEILNACTNRTIEETTIFDAKREVPAKSIDLAKDVSAFANTAGGSIIFGVDEDLTGRPCIPHPINLSGQRERIDSIIRTSVSEVPSYKITKIESAANTSIGYIVLAIPPSEVAPHMVIVKGDRRFYGRGETGNYVLGEAEVARLYERRENSKSNILLLLDEKINESPIQDHKGFSHLHVVIRPSLRSDDLIGRSRDLPDQTDSRLLTAILRDVIESNRFTTQYSPDFLINAWIRQPDGYLNKMWETIPGNNEIPWLRMEANFDGSGYLFCSRAAETIGRATESKKCLIPDLIAGNSVKFIDFFGRLYDKAKYFGMVDIAIGLTGLENCVDDPQRTWLMGHSYRHVKSSFQRTARVSASALHEDPLKIASSLIMPLISAVSQGRYDPFKQ